MPKRSKGRNWWWLLFLLALVALGYYLYPQVEPELKKVLLPKKVTPVQPERLTPEETRKAKAEEKKPETFPASKKEGPLESQPGQRPEQVAPKPAPEKDMCAEIEEEMKEFFHYLDKKKYVQQLDPAGSSYARFKDMLKRCSERLPVPAGEGTDPKILTKNLYHFFRVLGRKDLKLIRSVMAREQDSLEYILEMLYRWITLGNLCPDPEGLRPSNAVRYHYAGFFLNTIGGRAYIFRRTQSVRLLATYYCVLIVHDADKRGENSYGLDVVPSIAPLQKEMGLYSEFDLQREYLKKLGQIKDYYNKKR